MPSAAQNVAARTPVASSPGVIAAASSPSATARRRRARAARATLARERAARSPRSTAGTDSRPARSRSGVPISASKRAKQRNRLARQGDVGRVGELVAHAAGVASGGSGAELRLTLHQHDLAGAVRGQVIGRRGAHAAAADDHHVRRSHRAASYHRRAMPERGHDAPASPTCVRAGAVASAAVRAHRGARRAGAADAAADAVAAAAGARLRRRGHCTRAGPCWCEGRDIVAAGPAARSTAPAGAERVALPGLTLMPGLIEGHSHLLLHPYNETTWNDQVLREPLAYRVARAAVNARDTLMAGITTVRDLGTEGAGYADVGLKQSIDDGIMPGTAHARRRPGDGRHRHLRPEGLRARGHRAAGRGGGRRPRGRDPRGAPPDRPRRRLRQDLRRLPLGPERRGAADLHASRRSPPSSRWRAAAAATWRRTPARPKACGGRSSAASRPSTTATAARPRCGR